MNKDELKNLYPKMPEQFEEVVNKAVSKGLKDNGKVIRMKKKMFLILAATLAIGVTAIGAGKVAGILSFSNALSDFSNSSEIAEKSEDIGVEFKYVEEFANGYSFANGYMSTNNELDKNNEPLREYKSLNLNYSGDKGSVYLIVEKYMGNDDTEECEITTSTQLYKYVPVDYEMTQQDMEDMESGKYMFSAGNLEEEVTEDELFHVNWHEDGVSYALMQYGSRGSLTIDEMIEMAQEIIDAE